MSRFDRYMLSQLMVLFGFFSLVLVLVYWVNRAVLLFDRLIGDGQSALVFLEFTALTLPNVIRLVLPVSAFAAAVYVTNRLSSESELVVVQATGFSAFRLARGVLAFGLIVAFLMSVLTHVLVPASRTMMAQRQVEMNENVGARLLSEGQFLHPGDGITLFIRHITPQGELRDVFLSDARAKDSRTTYTAQRALLVKADGGPKLVMFDGMAQVLSLSDRRLSITSFQDFTYDIGALLGARISSHRDMAELGTWQLLHPTDATLTATGASRAALIYEGNTRFSGPLTALAAALLGFSALLTGSFSRFGVTRQIMLAIMLLILMQLLENLSADIGRSDASLWPLAYLPVLYGLVAATVMMWWSQRPRRRRRGATGPGRGPGSGPGAGPETGPEAPA
ncbi:LPS export ABC transporter permease LptF [Acidimangrovimonas pyrenivorans]|uniref:LPS export ABC transporter permease LptF n=1 Tax=Acidimangrovimonas pyrenivorans TaxID=2030798 RepID=A0ABV7AB77_9RHOB